MPSCRLEIAVNSLRFEGSVGAKSHTGIVKDGNERTRSLEPVQRIRAVSWVLMVELLPSGSSHVITARSDGLSVRLGLGAPQIFRRRTSLRAAAFRRVENQNTLQHRYFPHYIAFSTSVSGSSAEETVLLPPCRITMTIWTWMRPHPRTPSSSVLITPVENIRELLQIYQ